MSGGSRKPLKNIPNRKVGWKTEKRIHVCVAFQTSRGYQWTFVELTFLGFFEKRSDFSENGRWRQKVDISRLSWSAVCGLFVVRSDALTTSLFRPRLVITKMFSGGENLIFQCKSRDFSRNLRTTALEGFPTNHGTTFDVITSHRENQMEFPFGAFRT